MLVELTVYAADAIASARLLLTHDRLADLLATGAALDVRGIRVAALETGRRSSMDALQIDHNVILAVATGEPRGAQGRRLSTIAYPAVARVGPYEVRGGLHGPPSMDAFEVARRRTWVPLTNATISYHQAGREVRETSPVILAHRRFIASLEADERGERIGAGRSSTASGWPTEPDGSGAWG